MGVLKHYYRDPGYTKVYNDVLPSIPSARARGVLVTMLSKPEGWDFSADRLAAELTEGREATRTALNELKAAGLYRTERRQLDNGQWTTETWVSDVIRQDWIDEHEAERPTSEDVVSSQVVPKTAHRAPDTRLSADRASKPHEQATQENHQTRGVPLIDPPKERSTQVTLPIKDRNGSQELAKIEKRDDVERLCAHLAQRIEENGCNRPTVTKTWRDAARLMLDRDGRTERQVHTAIDWCQGDAFWCSNILSMPKLRKQYDRLRLQAQQSNGNGHRPSTTDQRVQETLALAAEYAERGE